MKLTTLLQIIFAFVLLNFIACNAEQKKDEKKDGKDILAKASRENKNGWVYVHLEGAPHDIGYQHGYLLANEIDTTIQAFAYFLQHETHRNWQFYRNCASSFLWNNWTANIKMRSMALRQVCSSRKKIMI